MSFSTLGLFQCPESSSDVEKRKSCASYQKIKRRKGGDMDSTQVRSAQDCFQVSVHHILGLDSVLMLRAVQSYNDFVTHCIRTTVSKLFPPDESHSHAAMHDAV